MASRHLRHSNSGLDIRKEFQIASVKPCLIALLYCRFVFNLLHSDVYCAGFREHIGVCVRVCFPGVFESLVKVNVKRSCLSLLTPCHGLQRPCKQWFQHAEMLRQD